MLTSLEELDGRTEDLDEAWELLAQEGNIPLEWLDNPRWKFICWECGADNLARNRFMGVIGHTTTSSREAALAREYTIPLNAPILPCLTCGGVRLLPRPSRLDEMWRFAEDPGDRMRVEALLHEALPRLQKLGLPKLPTAPVTIHWRYRAILGKGGGREILRGELPDWARRTARKRIRRTNRPFERGLTVLADGGVCVGFVEIPALRIAPLHALAESWHEILVWGPEEIEVAWNR